MKKKELYTFSILLLLCLGLFFINRYQTHDWGDDFALYLMQAKNTAALHFQFPTHYVFNTLNPIIAPPYYPPVFSVFLSVLYPLFQNEIGNYILVMHLLLILNILLFVYYLKSKYDVIIISIVCLLWAYNPWVLYFKNEVMSEFLFVIFLLLFFISYQKKASPITLLILGALLISTRSIGWAIVPAIAIDLVLKKEWKKNIVFCSGIILLTLIINFVFIGKISASNYNQNFKLADIIGTIQTNIQFYFKNSYNWFIPYLETKKQLILPTQIVTAALFFVGIAAAIKSKKYRLELLFSLFYFFVLLIYPYQGAGFRFLFPLIPVFLILFIEGLLFIKKMIPNVYLQKLTHYGIPLFLLLQYYPNINYLLSNKIEPNGPYTKEALQTWEAIKNHTTSNDTIYFTYPKTSGLLTNRYCKAFPETDNNITFFLEDASANNKYVTLLKNSRKFDTLWTNKQFTLFKKID